MNRKYNDDDYIDLAEIINALIHHIGILLFVGILCGAGMFLYCKFLAVPLYDGHAMMIVNSGERNDYVTQDQLNSASSLVDTYSVIITSDTVMDDVKKALDMDEDTYKEQVKDVDITAVNKTQIMDIKVRATSPETAVSVCQKITEICPGVIVRTVKAGSVELVSKASTTGIQVAPDVIKYTILTALLGIVLACIFIALITIMDNKVKGENDIKQEDLAVLGVIPFYKLEEK